MIPECPRKAETLVIVGNAEQSIFGPAISAGARMIVREVRPCISVGTVIFANGAPSAFGQVGPPAFPMLFMRSGFDESLLLGGHEKSGANAALEFSHGS